MDDIEHLKESLRLLIQNVNKWNMYIPSAEADAEIMRTLDLIEQWGIKEVIKELDDIKYIATDGMWHRHVELRINQLKEQLKDE